MLDPARLYDDRDIALRVSAHVLAFMDEAKVSQNEIARRAGVSSGRLSKFMNGERVEVPVSFIMRVADAIESNPTRVLRELPALRFLEDARRRATGSPTPPHSASPSPARPGKRSAGGGRH
jgi:transcriptional regulator with XRE-family HTH domain